jgi:hypothetical protein
MLDGACRVTGLRPGRASSRGRSERAVGRVAQWFPTTVEFSVVLDSADKAARDAAGWDERLEVLDEVVAGDARQRPPSPARWQAYYDEYRGRGLPASAPIPE